MAASKGETSSPGSEEAQQKSMETFARRLAEYEAGMVYDESVQRRH